MTKYLLMSLETDISEDMHSDRAVAVNTIIDIAVGEHDERNYVGIILAVKEVGIMDEQTQTDWKRFLATKLAACQISGLEKPALEGDPFV